MASPVLFPENGDALIISRDFSKKATLTKNFLTIGSGQRYTERLFCTGLKNAK